MCVFRDVGMCFVIASLFEILEVSLQHLIPEFAECWWDSVFMDSLGANALGIFLGYLTLRYLDSRHYQWIAYRPKGVTSRIKRVMWLFTPFSWSNCKWVLGCCLFVCGVEGGGGSSGGCLEMMNPLRADGWRNGYCALPRRH